MRIKPEEEQKIISEIVTALNMIDYGVVVIKVHQGKVAKITASRYLTKREKDAG